MSNTCCVVVALQGARGHLQAGFLRFMHGQVSRNRSAAQRGADPDPLRDVQVCRVGALCCACHAQSAPASFMYVSICGAGLFPIYDQCLDVIGQRQACCAPNYERINLSSSAALTRLSHPPRHTSW